MSASSELLLISVLQWWDMSSQPFILLIVPRAPVSIYWQMLLCIGVQMCTSSYHYFSWLAINLYSKTWICRAMRDRWSECRGCFFCIARCEDCGGCIDSEYLGEETVCSHLLCLECWLRLPKCNLCNRPYCYGHEEGSFASNFAAGFVCGICNDEMETSPNDVN